MRAVYLLIKLREKNKCVMLLLSSFQNVNNTNFIKRLSYYKYPKIWLKTVCKSFTARAYINSAFICNQYYGLHSILKGSIFYIKIKII